MPEKQAVSLLDAFAKTFWEPPLLVYSLVIFLFTIMYHHSSFLRFHSGLKYKERFHWSDNLLVVECETNLVQKLKPSTFNLNFVRVFHLIVFLVYFTGIIGLELKEEETLYKILNLNLDASISDIKKSYRQLALEYHPDKIFQLNPHLNDTEKSLKNDIFLKIQEAYEVLHDVERRLQYDLKLTGVQYDIIDHDDSEINPYMSQPFHLFVKSNKPKFKFHFSANFEKPRIPDINVRLEVSLEHLLKGLEKKHKFYRRVICSVCGGNGGLDGVCKSCDLCQGTGVAKLLYSHRNDDINCESKTCDKLKDTDQNGSKYDFEQMTETKCPSCKGKGCFSTGRCSNCNGVGISSFPLFFN
jgi:DnaJ-class molecular chaperone